MTFPTAQFIFPDYHKPYQLDISDKEGGLLVYIKSHLSSRLLSVHNLFTLTRYSNWLKKIQLAFCNPYGGVKTTSKESFPYVT